MKAGKIFDKLFKRKPKAANAEAEAGAPPPASEAPPEAAPKRAPSPDDDDYDPMSELPGYAPVNEDDVIRSVDGDAIDLDSQIEQLMKADSKASTEHEIHDVEELVQNKNIYDGSEAEVDWAAYGKKPTKSKPATLMSAEPTGLAAFSYKKAAILAAAALIVLAGVSLTAVNAARAVTYRRAQEERIARYTPIVQPVNVANNSNHIFINETAKLAGQSLTLQKMAIGSTGTYVYFNETFDPEQYAVALYDHSFTLYPRHRFDLTGVMNEGTVFKFDKVNQSAIFLTLLMQDVRTREAVTFTYRFDAMPTVTEPLVHNEPILVFGGGGKDFHITNAVFDNAGTEIYYSFTGAEGEGGLDFGDYTDKPFMQVTESIHPVKSITLNPPEARFDEQNVVLGKLNLAPLRNTKNNLEINLNDLFYRYDLPAREIDLSALFARRPEEQKIHAGGNALVLEGMAMQGDYVVLVLHGEDGQGDRLETRVDVSLTVETEEEPVILTGVSRSSGIGTDVLFDLTPYRALLHGIPLSMYRLSLRAVEFRVPKFTFVLDAAYRTDTPERRLGSANEAVKAAFLSRLRYKSYEKTREAIQGFAPEVLQDRALMRRYAPTGTAARPMYAVHVVNSMITDARELIAVVEDEWVADAETNPVILRYTHQITAQRLPNGSWRIVSDVIL